MCQGCLNEIMEVSKAIHIILKAFKEVLRVFLEDGEE